MNPGPRDSQTSQSTRDSSRARKQTQLSFSDSSDEPTLKDVMAKLSTMDTIDKKIDGLKEEVVETCAALKTELLELREEVSSLRTENATLQKENQDLHKRLTDVENKVDDLEGRSKRSNLLFHGLARTSGENCEKVVSDLLTDKLGLSDPVEFDRVHRVSDKKDSPIIARCTFFKDKNMILKAKKKLRGSDIFIGEDFSLRVRSVRKALSPHLKEARKSGKNAVMIFDHLLIDGRRFDLTSDRSGIQEVRKQTDK